MSDQQTIPSQTTDRGEPSSPLELPARDWKASLKEALADFKADRGTLIGAGMAFYWFLAVFPALLAAVGITGLVHASAETVNSIGKAIQSALPGQAATVLTDALKQASGRPRGSSVVATVIGIVLALWSASAGMVAVQSGLDVIYDVPQERPLIKKRARALVLIVMAVALGGVATAAIVFGQPIGDGIRGHLPFGGAFILVWTVLRWVVGLGALAALFAGFYFFGPNRERPRWTWLSPGGLVATLIWLLASLGFSFYVSSLGSYAKTYGSLTGVVVLMLWLYLSALALLVGAELNAQLERQGERERRRQDRRERKRHRAEQEPVTRPMAAPAPQPHAAGPPPTPERQAASAPHPAPDGYEREWLERMRAIRSGRS